MNADRILRPPLLTADLPGVGGRIKDRPADFEVEEIPAYAASGQGDFLYLWVEKTGLGAEYFQRQLASRLGVAPGEVGTAGLKDRHAVTRQWVSVPLAVRDRLRAVEGDGVRLLNVTRHGNKLKPGHLRGNRFRILVRDVSPDAAALLPPLLERLGRLGLPNYYGPQRFGRGGDNLAAGFNLLGHDPGTRSRNPFLKKLLLSAAQSALFNLVLARRLDDGLFRTVLPGDVMMKWPFGGLFVADDVPTEQDRFDRRETVTGGPIFGAKTFAAKGVAAEREHAAFAEAGVSPDAFRGFGKLLQGTRRHNLIYVDDLTAAAEPEGVRLTVTLPAGSYATVLLRELCKSAGLDAAAEPD